MFIGNAKAINLLNKAIENGKISQAYLFSGPESVGKFTLAKIFASSLILEQDTLNSDNISLEITSRNIPDMLIIKPEIEEKKGIVKEKELKVEHIRRAQKDLSLFPYSGKYKVAIIDNAHKMTVSAQSALLKTLEEPNETSVIILVTHNDSKIIPTIKSRCQKVNFFLASPGEIERMIGKDKNAKEIGILSMGRPGLAFELQGDNEKLEARKNDLEYLKKFQEAGINERLKLAEKMASDTAKAVKKLEFWTWVIRLESLKNDNRQGFFSFKTIEKIEKSLETMKDTNANTRLVIENLLLEI